MAKAERTFTQHSFYQMIRAIEPEQLRDVVADNAIANARDTTRLGRDPLDEDVEYWSIAFGTAELILDDPSSYMA